MNCRRTRRWLPLHVGGDLEPVLAAGIDEHLSACQACSGELRRYRAAQRDLRAAAVVAGAAGSLEPLWDSLQPRLAAVDVATRQRLPWYRRAGLVSAAAAVLLAGLTAPLWWRGGGAREPGSAAEPGGMLAGFSAGAARDGLIPVPPSELDRLLGSFVRRSTPSPSPVVQASNRGRF